MTLDLWLLGAVMLFAVFGYFSGALRMLGHWLALAVAYLAAKPAAAALSPLAAERFKQFPPKLVALGVGALAFPVIYILAGFAFRWILLKLLPTGSKTPADRKAGLALGAAKGAALVFLGLSVLASFEQPLAKAGWDLNKETGDSRALAYVREHNPFAAYAQSALEKAQAVTGAR